MAETKTNIPFQVKMGAEKDSSGASKLPSFEEGSLIITTDTKKVYVDPIDSDERIAVGGSEVVVDSELSKTSENPVQNKVINSALNDKQDKFADLDYVWNNSGDSVNQLSLVLKNASKTSSTGGVVSLIPKLSFANEAGQDIKLTGIAAPTADNDAVNKGYLTTKYGSTSYSSADSELYLPTGSNMVIPNTLMGRIFIGPDTDTPNSPDFKIYVNDTIDDGKLIITSLKTPSNDEDAANKKYVDDAISTKQDKFATVTTKDTVQTVKIGDNLSIVTSPNFGYSQISSSKILVLAGSDSTNSYVSLRMSKLENGCDFDATQGYLRVRDNPLADDFAVNKKYVDDAIGNTNSILATMFNDVSTQSDEEPTDEEVIA